jgi:predicted dehydrogenase
MNRKLRFGMVGGGRGAFIGAVHRLAAVIDGRAELVAGAFSSDPTRSKASGAALLLDPARVYGSYGEMAHAETQLPSDQHLDFVVIVTLNHEHFSPAKLFLEKGFNVVLDKPATFNLRQALRLRAIVRKSRKVFVLTHNYAGNVMVEQARHLVRTGALGQIRKVVVEYAQGWLSSYLEGTGQKQAAWRTDPRRSGAAGCIGDIGTHAENLVRHVSGILHASQICVGDENNLSLRVYGTKPAFEWYQEHPNELIVKYPDQPRRVYRPGNAYVCGSARRFVRIPAGHPEGYLEAFGNIYLEALRAIVAELDGRRLQKDLDFPAIDDGVLGMAFIETAVKSARLTAKWVKFPRV